MAEKKLEDSVGAVADGARERLSEVARGVEQRYQKVAEEMRKEADRATQAARQKVDTAVTSLKQGYTKVSKDMGELTEDVTDYVRDNPAKSLLIAAAAGFLLGLLFRRRDD